MTELPQSSLETLRKLQKEEEQSTPAPKRKWRSLIKFRADNLILLLMCGLLIVLGGISSWLVKSNQDKLEKRQSEVRTDIYQNKKSHEISLGESKAIATKPGNPDIVDVMTYETVLSVDGNHASLKDATNIINERRNRLNQEVGIVMRSASESDLAEPGLKKIRGRIKEKSQEVLESNIVLDVNFAEFQNFSMQTTF